MTNQKYRVRILIEHTKGAWNSMDYEKIIVELLSRIQTLEEKVASLMDQQETPKEKVGEKMTTENIRQYIMQLKENAKANGKNILVLTARDIHGELNLKSRYPMVCNAMRDCMGNNDIILFQPPKGNSSTLQIEYKL